MLDTRQIQSLWFIALSFFLFFIVLPLTRHGMFLDGIIYAAIAKNLSLGYGSLWHPFYSQTLFADFHEHPPLVFYFQSFFFSWFGKQFGVEQAYCLFVATLQFGLIAYYTHKIISKVQNLSSLYCIGLLLLFWMSIPLNHLYTSNHLEATLGIFTTIASLLLFNPTRNSWYLGLCLLGSALAMVVAFFCNGPTAFFPLAIPLLKKCFLDQGRMHQNTKWTNAILQGVSMSFILGLICLLMLTLFYLLVPDAKSNTILYLQQQLFPSISGARTPKYIGLKHFYIIMLYLRAYLPVTALACFCLFIYSRLEHTSFLRTLKHAFSDKNVLFYISVSLVASLPVGVSTRQALSYIMQSSPFYSLAMISMCALPVQNILHHLSKHIQWSHRAYLGSIVILFATIFYVTYHISGYNRDEAMQKDLKYIRQYCHNEPLISTDHHIIDNWYAAAYLARYTMLSLTLTPNQHYYLGQKGSVLPAGYYPLQLPLHYYILASRHDDAILTN